MPVTCDEVRSWIPQDRLGDLTPVEKQQLDRHLLECSSCSHEQELYADTFEQMRSVSELPVPRHFFVYPHEQRASWLSFLQGLAPGWKLASGFAALFVVALAGLAVSRFQFQAQNGVYSFSFGKPLKPAAVEVASSSQVQESLKKELIGLLEARSHEEQAKWMNTLRQEFYQSRQSLTQGQRRQWNAALNTLEARLTDRIEGSAVTLNAGMERSVGNLYQTLQRQRQQDLALTQNRLDRVAARGELKNQETEEILATLLQVADLGLQK